MSVRVARSIGRPAPRSTPWTAERCTRAWSVCSACSTDKLPETKATQGSNFCDVAVVAAPAERLVVAIAALDNLVKGASGQAVQCMNLMFDLPEEEGLWQPPLYP
jgi:N-acetyl-gamma-glutamylphosphate reductase